MSVIAALLAELTEPCATCGGTGELATHTSARPTCTARGITVPVVPSEPTTAHCFACRGRGTCLSDNGHALKLALGHLLLDEFASADHGHEVR